MRVLHVHSGNLDGGVETLLLTLARYRDLCPAMEPEFALCFEGRLSEELTAAEVPVHFLGEVRVRRPTTVWRARRRLKDLLQRRRFDLVVCHMAWPQALFGPVVRSAHLPLVFWLHSAVNGHHWLQLWARRTPPDLALCNSRFTQSTLPNMYPKVCSQLIHCPVSANTPRASDSERQGTRAEFHTPTHATVIVQPSRMEAGKG